MWLEGSSSWHPSCGSWGSNLDVVCNMFFSVTISITMVTMVFWILAMMCRGYSLLIFSFPLLFPLLVSILVLFLYGTAWLSFFMTYIVHVLQLVHVPHQWSSAWRASLAFINDYVEPPNTWGVHLDPWVIPSMIAIFLNLVVYSYILYHFLFLK